MEENEFKKLTANSRDWLIYSLLTNINPTLGDGIPTDARFPATDIKSEHVSGVNIEIRGEKEVEDNVHGSRTGESVRTSSVATNSKPPNPKGETTVRETIQGIVRIVTDLAVQIVVGIRAIWIPKSAIKNLAKVVLEQGKPVSVDIHAWFVPKMEWKVL